MLWTLRTISTSMRTNSQQMVQEDTQGEDGESSQDSGTDEENTEEGTEG